MKRYVFVVDKRDTKLIDNYSYCSHLSAHESPIAAIDKARRLAGIGFQVEWPSGGKNIVAFVREDEHSSSRITVAALELED